MCLRTCSAVARLTLALAKLSCFSMGISGGGHVFLVPPFPTPLGISDARLVIILTSLVNKLDYKKAVLSADIFSWAFVPIDPLNGPTKFKVRIALPVPGIRGGS